MSLDEVHTIPYYTSIENCVGSYFTVPHVKCLGTKSVNSLCW